MKAETRMMVFGLLAAALVATPARAQQSDSEWLAKCQQDNGRQARACEVRPVSMVAGALITVDATPNGGISITGGQANGVSGSARLQAQADTESEARELLAQVQIHADGNRVSATGPRHLSDKSWSASFVLTVPKRSDLELSTVNGPIALQDVSGRIEAETTNGPMTLRGLAGDVKARATNGPLTVVLSGSAWDGAGLDAETTNGPVRLQIPEGYSAMLDAGTTNGPFTLGFPITLQGALPMGRHATIRASIGSGGAPIRVRTTNGPVSVDRR